MQIKPDYIYNTKEAAELLRKKPSALATGRCRKDFALAWIKIGRKVGYLGKDLINFIEQGRVEVPIEPSK